VSSGFRAGACVVTAKLATGSAEISSDSSTIESILVSVLAGA